MWGSVYICACVCLCIHIHKDIYTQTETFSQKCVVFSYICKEFIIGEIYDTKDWNHWLWTPYLLFFFKKKLITQAPNTLKLSMTNRKTIIFQKSYFLTMFGYDEKENNFILLFINKRRKTKDLLSKWTEAFFANKILVISEKQQY